MTWARHCARHPCGGGYIRMLPSEWLDCRIMISELRDRWGVTQRSRCDRTRIVSVRYHKELQ